MYDAVFLLNTAKLLINGRLLYTCYMIVEFNSFDGTPVGERFKDYEYALTDLHKELVCLHAYDEALYYHDQIDKAFQMVRKTGHHPLHAVLK